MASSAFDFRLYAFKSNYQLSIGQSQLMSFKASGLYRGLSCAHAVFDPLWIITVKCSILLD